MSGIAGRMGVSETTVRSIAKGDTWADRADWPLANCWAGTLIESDCYAFRANYLRATPAAVRFLSLEPLLGPLPSLDLTGIDWVIVGGESGPDARPIRPRWVRDIRDRCVAASIPFFFKQWGEFVSTQPGCGCPDRYRDAAWQVGEEFWPVWRVGKKAAGRELDGRTWDEMPERTALPVPVLFEPEDGSRQTGRVDTGGFL